MDEPTYAEAINLLDSLRAKSHQPRIISIGPIGSRGDMLHVMFGRYSVWVETGCFAGTLNDLYGENLQAHDPDSIAYQEYSQAIAFIDALARLYRP